MNISFAAYNQIIDDTGLVVGNIWNREGKKVKVLGPKKIPFVIPFVQKFEKTHIKSNTQHLPDMRITLKNTLSYTFDASVEYDILDDPDHLENVLFVLEDHLEFVTLNFKIAIQTVLYQYDSAPEKMKSVGADIKKELTTLLGDHGFKVIRCGCRVRRWRRSNRRR